MELTELSHQVLTAMAGGVAAELLHWYHLSRKPGGAKPFAKGSVYWVVTGAMIVFGGLMPFLYLDGEASALLCFHLGATTPLILQKLVATIPSATVPQGGAPSPIAGGDAPVAESILPAASMKSFLSW